MNHYAHASSFQNTNPLTEDQLLERAPSIFAYDKHESRSDRFQPIPTISLVRRMADEGFQPYHARQSRTRDESRRPFTKHMIRFRHESQMNQGFAREKIGEEVFEVGLVNGNDGSSSYNLFAACWRLVCLNGMVCSEKYATVRVRHTGDVIPKVIEGSYKVLGQAETMALDVNDMKSTKLSRDESYAFGEAAIIARYGLDSDDHPVRPEHVLHARRQHDVGTDLWRTFQRTQENLTKGDEGRRFLGSYHRTENGQRRWRSVRALNDISNNNKFQQALWHLTERMRELKT